MKSLIEKTRYFTLIAVVTLLVTSVFAMLWAAAKAVKALGIMLKTYGNDPLINFYLIQIVDAFLIAIVLYLLGVSIYAMFVGELNLPQWALAHNLHELKSKLGGMIILVMTVKFSEVLLEGQEPRTVLLLALSTALVSAALIAFSYFGSKE